MSREWDAPSTSNSIDVGASPGSWTSFLATRGTGTVLAVDPGDLEPEVLALANVIHSRTLASPSTVSDIRTSLPPGRPWTAGCLVCDMNNPPSQAISACDALTSLLYPGAYLILTLKLSCGKSVDGRAAQEKEAMDAMQKLEVSVS